MKRSFNDTGNDGQIMDHHNITKVANYLMRLSEGSNGILPSFDHTTNKNTSYMDLPSKVFECKTCNRQFPSFQALGGHRASHKKPKLTNSSTEDHDSSSSIETHRESSPMKPKTHECSICGLEFAIGQALGGHMRRHRAIMNNIDQEHNSTKNKKVLLDLNLTPFENGLELLRVSAPLVDVSFRSF